MVHRKKSFSHSATHTHTKNVHLIKFTDKQKQWKSYQQHQPCRHHVLRSLGRRQSGGRSRMTSTASVWTSHRDHQNQRRSLAWLTRMRSVVLLLVRFESSFLLSAKEPSREVAPENSRLAHLWGDVKAVASTGFRAWVLCLHDRRAIHYITGANSDHVTRPTLVLRQICRLKNTVSSK